jgi:hypothetical protein
MTKPYTFDERMEAWDRRRHNADARADVRRERQELAQERERAAIIADPRVGQLCREGHAVYYVNGAKYHESSDPLKLGKYL